MRNERFFAHADKNSHFFENDMTTFAELMKEQGVTRKRTHEEDELQMACKEWWDYAYCHELAIRLDLSRRSVNKLRGLLRLLLHHSPNEGELPDRRAGAKRKRMGVRAGFPDFILLIGNAEHSTLSVELKSAKGRQSAAQKEYEEAVRLAFGKYALVRSRDQFEEVVREYMETARIDN